MPGRSVTESLNMRRFLIGPTWIEAEFDRSYESEMLDSPSHLTFISALIQMQKITYVYCCSKFGFKIDVDKPEHLKVWPTSLDIKMPAMVTEDQKIIHRLDFLSFRKVERYKYFIEVQSAIGNILKIDAGAIIQLLRPS